MNRAVGIALLAVLAMTLASVASSANGQTVSLAPAFDVFPGTQYDTAFTRSYDGAHGSAVVTVGGGNNPACTVVANGLLANTSYTVHLDLNGSTAGDVSTAGPWVEVGQFDTNNGGHGKFEFTSAPPSGTAIYVNEAAAGLTVLISGNIP